MINKRLLRIGSIILVNIILGVFISKWLWLHVDFYLIVNEAMLLDQKSIIAAVVLGISLYLFYGLRMASLLDVKLLPSIQIVIMGFGLNSFLPFRSGDVFKVIFAKQFFRVDLTKTSIATIVEKVMDLAVIGCFAFIFIFGNLAYFSLLVTAFFSTLFLFLNFKKKLFFKFKNQIANKFLSITQLMLAKKKHKVVVLSTLSIWGLTFLGFYVFFKMNMLPGVIFTSLDAITLVIFTTLSLAIPSLPAGLGLFESGIVYYLTHHFHFAADKAVAYALIFHLIIILPQVFFTIIILLSKVIVFDRISPVLNDN